MENSDLLIETNGNYTPNIDYWGIISGSGRGTLKYNSYKGYDFANYQTSGSEIFDCGPRGEFKRDGWTTSSTGTSPVSLSTNLSSTYYATFGRDLTLDCNNNGGSGGLGTQSSYQGYGAYANNMQNSYISLASSSYNPTKSGSVFLKWQTGSGESYGPGGSYYFNNKLYYGTDTLYAQWGTPTLSVETKNAYRDRDNKLRYDVVFSLNVSRMDYN